MLKQAISITHLFLIALFVMLLIAGFFFAATPSAHAKPNTVLVVNSLADTSGGPNCTLRDAIQSANWNTPYGGCAAGSPGADTITFSVTGTITLAGALGSPRINEPLTIMGPTGGITIDGVSLYRAFLVYDNQSLSLANLTIENTVATDAGGAVSVWCNQCIGNIDSVTFISNSVTGGLWSGGALFSSVGATLNVSNSTFIKNKASPGSGGAIGNYGVLNITNSTFISNTADNGAAITNQYTGTTTIVNSTFLNNTGGGSVQSSGDPITLRNTIIANTVGANCSADIINGGFNLQYGGTQTNSCGTTIPTLNPLLGVLGDYGGKTKTIPLLPGSPAINAIVGNVNCPRTDQRGIQRAVGLWCDIGAYEAASIVGYLPLVKR